jgi:hypothetical protein
MQIRMMIDLVGDFEYSILRAISGTESLFRKNFTGLLGPKAPFGKKLRCSVGSQAQMGKVYGTLLPKSKNFAGLVGSKVTFGKILWARMGPWDPFGKSLWTLWDQKSPRGEILEIFWGKFRCTIFHLPSKTFIPSLRQNIIYSYNSGSDMYLL